VALPGYQARVRLLTDIIPRHAVEVARYELETLAEAQAECSTLISELI
jgi:hypothetical protein